jgi:hypothetical protein
MARAPLPFPERGLMLQGFQQLLAASLGRPAPVGHHRHHDNRLPRGHMTHPMAHANPSHPVASGTGGGTPIATVTFIPNYVFDVGDTVIVANVAPAGYMAPPL